MCKELNLFEEESRFYQIGRYTLFNTVSGCLLTTVVSEKRNMVNSQQHKHQQQQQQSAVVIILAISSAFSLDTNHGEIKVWNNSLISPVCNCLFGL